MFNNPIDLTVCVCLTKLITRITLKVEIFFSYKCGYFVYSRNTFLERDLGMNY